MQQTRTWLTLPNKVHWHYSKWAVVLPIGAFPHEDALVTSWPQHCHHVLLAASLEAETLAPRLNRGCKSNSLAAHLWEATQGHLGQGALCDARGAALSQRLAEWRQLRGSRRRRRRAGRLPAARAPSAGARRQILSCVILGCLLSNRAALPLCILVSGCFHCVGYIPFWLLIFRWSGFPSPAAAPSASTGAAG